jgi:hypothetical protein
MPIPAYADWIKKTTLGITKPRSSALKLVDTTLKKYGDFKDVGSTVALDDAWRKWKQTKAGWQNSERNVGGILVELDKGITERLKQLNLFKGKEVTPEDRAIIKYMDDERKKMVRTLFEGHKVRLKGSQAVRDAKTALADLKKKGDAFIHAVDGAPAPATGAAGSAAKAAIEKMLSDTFDGASAGVINSILMPIFGADLIASMVPVVGHLKSGGAMIAAWGSAIKTKYDQHRNLSHKIFIGSAGSDAAKAFEKLDHLLRGEVNSAIISAGVKTASFTAKSLLVLADGGAVSGPAVGAAEALASITQKIAEIAMEYKETKRANAILSHPEQLDWRVFDAYPLLGAYMLSCATLSDIMNMSLVEFGGQAWQDDVEHMKKEHIDPVRVKCRMLIDKSLFEVEGMTPYIQKADTLFSKYKNATNPTGAAIKKF